MKKVLISLLIIAAVTGLMGSSLADFSDIESSKDNYFATGSLDLLISDELGELYEDPDVPVIYTTEDAWPDCPNPKTEVFDLTNNGQGDQFMPYAYVHLKNISCSGIIKTEPELAAETGHHPIGELEDGTYIYAAVDPTKPAENGNLPILGEFGEGCELSKHVDITIYTTQMSSDGTAGGVDDADWVLLDISQYDIDQNGKVKIDEIFCNQVELGQLANEDDTGTPDVWENRVFVKLELNMQDVDEDDLVIAGIIPEGLFDETIPAEAKWDHWPTNALMKDRLEFDLSFELLQFASPSP